MLGLNLGNDSTVLFCAFAGGIIPALLWLWFWLKEDKKKPEPTGLILLSFISGMVSVFVALMMEQMAEKFLTENTLLFALATIEEIVKYSTISVVAFKSRFFDEPIDAVVYMITVALGFAALENSLFLIEPLSGGESLVGFLTGNLRFLGATLLHVTTSGIVGIAIGLSFYKNGFIKFTSTIIGLITATVLHTVFNFFIIKGSTDTFLVFPALWLCVIVIIYLFEKVKRIKNN